MAMQKTNTTARKKVTQTTKQSDLQDHTGHSRVRSRIIQTHLQTGQVRLSQVDEHTLVTIVRNMTISNTYFLKWIDIGLHRRNYGQVEDHTY